MSTKGSATTTLSLFMAVWISLKKLGVVWGLPPLLVALAPFVTGVILGALNAITRGHGLLFAVLSVAMVAFGRRLICRYAPTPKARDDALAKSRLMLPLLSAAFNLLAIQYAIAPLAQLMGHEKVIKVTPHIHFQTALRLAVGMLFLGFAVVARFLGPFSVVRCSSMPLVSNPTTSAISATWSRCTSLDGVLDLIAGPSDTPGVLIESTFATFHNLGRRYQRPTSQAATAQILLSAVVGVAVAYITVLGWYQAPHHEHQHTDPFVKTALVATSALTILVNLLRTTLDGWSHELNPKRYQSEVGVRNFLVSFLSRRATRRTFVSSVVFVPLLSLALAILVGGTHMGDLWTLGLVCLVTTTVESAYLGLVDEAARMTICVPGLKLNTLVWNICGDVSPDLCLDVMLNSVLQGDASLVRAIWTPTKKLDTEEQEVKRNDASMQQMADILLHRPSRNSPDEACLEQDMLRELLLESLGGSGDKRDPKTGTLLMASDRHVETVKSWIGAANMRVMREPVVVPLVRGLCAYIGGLGEALLSCTQSISPAHSQTRPWYTRAPHMLSPIDSSSFVSWSLPPGAIACAEYAITGATRCIVWNFAASSEALADWRSAHLAMLVSSVLHSAYRLRCGLLSYAQYTHQNQTLSGSGELLNGIAILSPELRPLLLACDDAAILIMKTLQSPGGNVNIQVQSGCRAWLQSLESRSA